MPMQVLEMFVFFCLCSWSLAGVFGVDEVKSVSVTEGDSVTLHTDDTDTQRNDLIMWKFGQNVLIAQIDRKNNMPTIFNDNADGRFRDRLKLDQTGSLTITNTTTTHSGLYKVYSSKTETALNIFSLIVYAHVPIPVISTQNHLSSSVSSASSCLLLCSVGNVSHVSLSWYKGNSLLSSISVSDFNISVSLPLEIKCLDDFYSCVINNPISNQTRYLNISGLCHTCAEVCICCCGFTEAVIRLALSVLVGVAAVAVLVYDIRSRSLQQKKREQTSLSNSD